MIVRASRIPGIDPSPTGDNADALQAVFDKLPDRSELLMDVLLRISRELVLRERDGVHIGADAGGGLVKGWTPSKLVTKNRSLLRLERCTDTHIEGVTFIGGTPVIPATNDAWNDDGIYASACRGLWVVGCHFRDFGDSAVRMTSTGEGWDPLPTGVVDAFDYYVIGCDFDNVFQTSTTPGGVRRATFRGNVFRRLRGSVKFASRNPGAGDITFEGNDLEGELVTLGADGKTTGKLNRQGGLELHGVDEVDIVGNRFAHLSWAAVTLHETTKGVATTPDGTPIPVPWNRVRMPRDGRNRFDGCEPFAIKSGMGLFTTETAGYPA